MSDTTSSSDQDAEFLPGQEGGGKRRILMPALALVILIALVVAWWLLDWPAQQDAESGISTDERIARVEAGQQQSRQAVEALRTQQAAWQDQMLAEMDSRLSQGSQRDAGQRARIQASLDSLTSTQVSLAQRIAQMEQRLLGLAAQTTGGREVMQLTEIEFLLRHAARRLQLAGDPEGARVVLQQAQDSLDALSAPALNGVAQELAAVIAALESVPPVDLARISGQLLALERAVPDWPLAEATRSVEAAIDTDAEATWWQRLKSGLGDLVVVRQRAESDPVLLQVNEARALRANVQIELTAARLAALRRDEAAYRSALAQAEQWRKQYFATEAEMVRHAGNTLARLAGTDLDPDYPDLAPLLEQLQRQRQLMALPSAPSTPANRTPVLIEPASEQEQSPQQSTDSQADPGKPTSPPS